MSLLPEDESAGHERPPKRTRRKRGWSSNDRCRNHGRSLGTVEIIDKLWQAPVDITENGIPRRVSTLEAIILQLLRKAHSGDQQGLAALLRYEALVVQHPERTIEISFIDSDYTRALTRAPSSE
jgi:Family of unknown function (DUF5681)